LKEFQRRKLISDADYKAFKAEVDQRVRAASERTIAMVDEAEPREALPRLRMMSASD
jgi:hypothetical protein